MAQQNSGWPDDIDATPLSSQGYSSEAPGDINPLVCESGSAIFVNPAVLTRSNPSLSCTSRELNQFYQEANGQIHSTILPTERFAHASPVYPEASPSSSLSRAQQGVMNIDSIDMPLGADRHPTISPGNYARVSLLHDSRNQPYQRQSYVDSLGYSGSISQSSHTSSSMFGTLGATEIRDTTLQLIPLLNLQQHVVGLIVAANESKNPPTVSMHNNVPVLDFSAFAKFQRSHTSDVQMALSSTTISSEQVERHIVALQTFQHVRTRRSQRTDESSPPGSRIFQCTLGHGCSEMFKRKGDWKRHENAHFPQEVWLCEPLACAPGERFLRKERFIEPCNRVHPEVGVRSKRAESFRHEVFGSRWPRTCPFRTCRKSNFLNFDDRLEHIAQQHSRETYEPPVDSDSTKGNNDQDREGKDGGSFNSSQQFQSFKDCFHGSAHSGHSTFGAGSSDYTSSYAFTAPNSSCWTSNGSNNPETRVSPTTPNKCTKTIETTVANHNGQLVATQSRTPKDMERVQLLHLKETIDHAIKECEPCPVSHRDHGEAHCPRSTPETNHKNVFYVLKKLRNRRKPARGHDAPVERVPPRNMLNEHDLYMKMISSYLGLKQCSTPFERFVQQEVKDGPWFTCEFSRSSGARFIFDFHGKQARDNLKEKIRRLDMIVNTDHPC